MINEKVFFEFYSEKVSSDIVEMENEYRALKAYWDEFIRYYSIKEKTPDDQIEIVQYCLYVCNYMGCFFCFSYVM